MRRVALETATAQGWVQLRPHLADEPDLLAQPLQWHRPYVHSVHEHLQPAHENACDQLGCERTVLMLKLSNAVLMHRWWTQDRGTELPTTARTWPPWGS